MRLEKYIKSSSLLSFKIKYTIYYNINTYHNYVININVYE